MNRTIRRTLIPGLSLGMLLAAASLIQTEVRAQSNYFSNDARREHRLIWSGDVDDTTIVSLRRADVRTRDVHGKDCANFSSELFGGLPQRPYVVFLRRAAGRGVIQIVRQPDPENDYTAVVRIYDPQPGRSHYSFVLSWAPRQGI